MRVPKNINLIMLSKWPVGGSKSLTVQAALALEAVGCRPRILRPTKHRTSRHVEIYGQIGDMIPWQDMVKFVQCRPSLITACAPVKELPVPDYTEQLIKAGARIAVYDPNEFKIYPHMDYVLKHVETPMIIRKTMREFFPKGVLIRNPYTRVFSEHGTGGHKQSMHAVSIARTASVKNTDIILKANALIKNPKKRVALFGAEDRLFSYNMRGRGFDVKVHKMPQTLEAGAHVCRSAKFAVDLTVFKNDGGEQQYSFLQAADAGAVNIIHKDWANAGTMWKHGENCFVVSTPEELAAILTKRHDQRNLGTILKNAARVLKLCSPTRTGNQLKRFLS